MENDQTSLAAFGFRTLAFHFASGWSSSDWRHCTLFSGLLENSSASANPAPPGSWYGLGIAGLATSCAPCSVYCSPRSALSSSNGPPVFGRWTMACQYWPFCRTWLDQKASHLDWARGCSPNHGSPCIWFLYFEGSDWPCGSFWSTTLHWIVT